MTLAIGDCIVSRYKRGVFGLRPIGKGRLQLPEMKINGDGVSAINTALMGGCANPTALFVRRGFTSPGKKERINEFVKARKR